MHGATIKTVPLSVLWSSSQSKKLITFSLKELNKRSHKIHLHNVCAISTEALAVRVVINYVSLILWPFFFSNFPCALHVPLISFFITFPLKDAVDDKSHDSHHYTVLPILLQLPPSPPQIPNIPLSSLLIAFSHHAVIVH